MTTPLQSGVIAALLALGLPMAVQAGDDIPGASVENLLQWAKDHNPDYASMRFEAQAAAERVTPAGALMDPKLRIEWMDITRMGEQNPTLLPGNVGSTKYTLMQDLPWFGKRELKKGIADYEAQASQGKVLGVWSELAARIKIAQAQRFYLRGNENLAQEILDLMNRLEQVAQSRYAGGLTAQQDVIRAQIEQTNMHSELVMLQGDSFQVDARLNALLARPTTEPLAVPESLRPLPAAAQLDVDVLARRLRRRNPQLAVEEARIGSAEKNQDLTFKNRYPDFTLAISPTQTDRSVNEWSLMLEMNIPLQQSSRRAMERDAQAMLDAAHSRKESAANQLLSELTQNLAGIEAARRTQALVTGSLLPQAQLTFRSALTGYENGKLDFATLLDAQRQIRQARQSQLKAQFDAQMRLAEIEKLLGEDL